MNKQHETQIVQSIESKLERFADEPFTALCEQIRLLLATGQVDSACLAVRRFAAEQKVQPLSPGTSIQDCGLPERVANALESAGYQTLGSLAGVTESEVTQVQGIGPGVVQQIREVVADMVRQQAAQRSPVSQQGFYAAPDRVVPVPVSHRELA